ncbi:hypothetical protein BKA93DRAFT_173930 [Sparassis latifolia]|uniref:Cora-domain-containing protein n=1 Tax=Sparassis crispa TaxID=139825 RepID=A0A401G764_9APHY|nr:hypothetical protein SCP_0108750 [Sparassis crispa]GBE77993.1 hypothetical protein SCP_0108750 [Sparassis crispa]
MASIGGPSGYLVHLPEPLAVLPDHNTDRVPTMDRDDHDIYRGELSSTPRSTSPSSASSASSSSSTSGGHLGALTAVVEHAIARWARAWASSSSLETSSSSSDMSMVTMTKSQMARRRRRRRSIADAHNARSEREVAARIKAREESRHIPRAFDLYVPYPLDLPSAGTAADPDGLRKHAVHTSSLPLILSHLAATLRENAKARRGRIHTVSPEAPASSRLLLHDYMMPEQSAESHLSFALPDGPTRPRMRKGKRRAATAPAAAMQMTLSSGDETAWWLDVASPTWEDMSAIGKLLHLHPLTLEDILQQDPREKIELFPKLGYHFIAFRAIESQKTRELRSVSGGHEPSLGVMEEGLVGEVNVYLVIFRDGVCSFHFADIGEHVDRVRNKILKLAESVNMSSDSIAHGIMDSIVDSVFPILDGIEKEVAEIENHAASSFDDKGYSVETVQTTCDGSQNSSSNDQPSNDEKMESPISMTEKIELGRPVVRRRSLFSLPTNVPSLPRRLLYHIREIISHFRVVFMHSSILTTTATVHRIARTRKIVTSLARFLAHKSEVVAQIQKRLFLTGGTGNGKDYEMFIYMGDVQDHILTLQQSLAHYDRVLSQAHPTYIARLRLSLSRAQSGTDRAILTLTTISIGVVAVQMVIGLNSMNVLLPTNSHTGHRYWLFGIVISASTLVLLAYALLLRWWWVGAKKKRRNYL